MNSVYIALIICITFFLISCVVVVDDIINNRYNSRYLSPVKDELKLMNQSLENIYSILKEMKTDLCDIADMMDENE